MWRVRRGNNTASMKTVSKNDPRLQPSVTPGHEEKQRSSRLHLYWPYQSFPYGGSAHSMSLTAKTPFLLREASA